MSRTSNFGAIVLALAALTAGALFQGATPSVAHAEADIDGDEELSASRKRFINDCRTHAYNQNCARYFEAKNQKRKSEVFCEAYPEDASCIDYFEEKERVEEARRNYSVQRELANYCQENPDAPRCAARGRKRSKSYPRF